MMKKLLPFVFLVLGACENKLTYDRKSTDPMSLEFKDLIVSIYGRERVNECGGQCGYDYIGYPPTPIARCCTYDQIYKVREDVISVTLDFPVGSELEIDQTEKLSGEFFNDLDNPYDDHGYINVKVKSKHHKYNQAILKSLPVYYKQTTTVPIQLN